MQLYAEAVIYLVQEQNKLINTKTEFYKLSHRIFRVVCEIILFFFNLHVHKSARIIKMHPSTL